MLVYTHEILAKFMIANSELANLYQFLWWLRRLLSYSAVDSQNDKNGTKQDVDSFQCNRILDLEYCFFST